MIYSFFDEKNTPYFVFAFGIVLVALVIFLIVRLVRFEKAFAHGKVKIVPRIEIDAITGEEIIKFSIVNRSFNSVEIRGFGFKHYNHDYDFMKNYKIEHELKPDEKLFIASRETLEAVISLDNLKVKLNSTNIHKFKAYVIDVYGNYIRKSAKYVERYIELFFKRVENIAKINAMPAEKKQKYLDKQNKLDARAQGVLNKSLQLKLKNDELSEEAILEDVITTPTTDVIDVPVEETTIEQSVVTEQVETEAKVEEAVEEVTEQVEETVEETEDAVEEQAEETAEEATEEVAEEEATEEIVEETTEETEEENKEENE